MQRTRGARCHPRTQGKVERWHQTLKNRIPLENYDLPGDLEARIEAFVAYYRHRRCHDGLGNLTPAGVYFGRGQTILLERAKIKRQAIEHRRLQQSVQKTLMTDTLTLGRMPVSRDQEDRGGDDCVNDH